nr:MAG TPA: hypothetical protein [Caudoviricetes sp.]
MPCRSGTSAGRVKHRPACLSERRTLRLPIIADRPGGATRCLFRSATPLLVL